MTTEELTEGQRARMRARMTAQQRSEVCYNARQQMLSLLGYIDLGKPEKATEYAEKINDLLLRMLIDAREEAKGTPDYKPNPF